MLSTNTSVTFLISPSQSNMLTLWLAVVSVTKLVVHSTCLKVSLATICGDTAFLAWNKLSSLSKVTVHLLLQKSCKVCGPIMGTSNSTDDFES